MLKVSGIGIVLAGMGIELKENSDELGGRMEELVGSSIERVCRVGSGLKGGSGK